MAADYQKELLSSLISDIKNYSGRDPLRPWIHGVRKMKESLPPQILKSNLPRFLQKCAQTFESDRRYRNDSRFLRVWIELMDYVDDAKVILRKMERNQIGLKRASFYLAYALYYEKKKKFEKAEKMYHLGVQNLAEPVGELQKAYEQFLHRMELYKKRKAKLQEAMSRGKKSTSQSISQGGHATEDEGASKKTNNLIHKDCEIFREGITENLDIAHSKDMFRNMNITGGRPGSIEGVYMNSMELKDGTMEKSGSNCHPKHYADEDLGSKQSGLQPQGSTNMDSENLSCSASDDTFVVKFVGSAFVGKSEAEDACHHGLVDPTINMKEAMSAINSMFQEPLEPEPMVRRRSHRNQPKINQKTNGFEIFIDEGGANLCTQNPKNNKNDVKHPAKLQPLVHGRDASNKQTKTMLQKPFVGEFKILADDEEDEYCEKYDERIDRHSEGCRQPSHDLNGFCYAKPDGWNLHCCDDMNMTSSGLKEDTVIQRFVGSAVFGEPKVENACHHGLVDPTINLKEAMDDINSMFGKPLNFFKDEKPKRKQTNPSSDPILATCGFSILADDDVEENSNDLPSSSTLCNNAGESDLFEPTIFTREAMADINDMFGKPLDF
ncbi:uncharacterized protein [Typha angustifolia]|uniref:uncharacterized protein isoform X1 n=1 Tax=Typha angustifolia TaxID=59011 RepID=UPI003C2EC92F